MVDQVTLCLSVGGFTKREKMIVINAFVSKRKLFVAKSNSISSYVYGIFNSRWPALAYLEL